jgi:hypothetical protein
VEGSDGALEALRWMQEPRTEEQTLVRIDAEHGPGFASSDSPGDPYAFGVRHDRALDREPIRTSQSLALSLRVKQQVRPSQGRPEKEVVRAPEQMRAGGRLVDEHLGARPSTGEPPQAEGGHDLGDGRAAPVVQARLEMHEDPVEPRGQPSGREEGSPSEERNRDVAVPIRRGQDDHLVPLAS